MARLAARFVDQILKGIPPGDLAAEYATEYKVIINLRTAKELGITVPPQLLARADEAIEYQEPRRRSAHNPRSRRLRNPDQLRRRERYRPDSWPKGGVKIGRRLTISTDRAVRERACRDPRRDRAGAP